VNYNNVVVWTDLRYGSNTGRPTTAIDKVPKPSHRKGSQSEKNKLVRSVVREVAGFAPYERRVMELLRNSKVRTSISARRVQR
jgi:large subunit ribosomal protein L36e